MGDWKSNIGSIFDPNFNEYSSSHAAERVRIPILLLHGTVSTTRSFPSPSRS